MSNIEWGQVVTAADKAQAQAEATKAHLTSIIDQHVEDTATSRNYNGAAHLAGYATSTVTDWQAEAQAFVAWRDHVWLTAFGILADIESGERAVPDAAALIAEMPQIAWPD